MIDSPVNHILKKLVDFDKSMEQPVYQQVSQQIVSAIQRKHITKGTKLPGSRVLGALLNIHRNTAVAIYEETAAQGWIEIIPNKGTFVLEPALKTGKIKGHSQRLNQISTYTQRTGYPFQKSFHLASTIEITEVQYTINDGKPDLRLHPVHQFTRWYSAAMKRKSLIQKWNRPTEFSYSLFQTQLCNYLNATRGFHIQPNNLLSTRSTEMSLYIISQLIIKQNDTILVGNLSNYAANMIFQQVGANIKTIPVDKNGLDIEYIKKHFIKGSVRCVYICAHRDYPTLIKLSVDRRTALLKLAKELEFAIIEDDYDYDFQFEGTAMLPMASKDPEGMVIYLGKLGQSLFPSFQTGFVIAPKNLISEAKNYLQLLDKQGDLIQEQMLSELINEGEIYRLMKKNIVAYKLRRDTICKELSTHFSEISRWATPAGGLAIWLEFEPAISLVKLAAEAKKNDLFLPKTLLYQNKNTCAIRFGFGHLNTIEIPIVIQKLKVAYQKLT
jgi:GntR family transcriptional regulator/MocR family aminotransferase